MRPAHGLLAPDDDVVAAPPPGTGSPAACPGRSGRRTWWAAARRTPASGRPGRRRPGSARPDGPARTRRTSRLGGRLSITYQPRSSRLCAAVDRPAPDIPVAHDQPQRLAGLDVLRLCLGHECDYSYCSRKVLTARCDRVLNSHSMRSAYGDKRARERRSQCP